METETKIEHRHMTFEEKIQTAYQSVLLRQKGEREEATKLLRSVPLQPEIAKIGKDVYGADFLIEGGYNLLEANEVYGEDWLYK
jgi:hypothetical protein